MVRAVLVVSRHRGQPTRLDAYRDALNRNLAGSNITPRPPVVVHESGLSAALLNPSGAARMHGASIAIGTLLEPRDDWHIPGAELPDGSFALLRANDTHVELAADGVASRTLWYALTDHELIASSSQRAIVTLLGSFEPNRDVLPWMLSSGTLGPSAAWDARLHRVQPGERVVLDRASWRLTSTIEPLDFAPDDAASRTMQLERLRAAVDDACRRWSFNARKWVLTLSGGADSRSLLCLLHHRGIGTVTWGVRNSAEQDGNDAQIARLLTSALDVPHRFFTIDSHDEAPEVVLERFLAAGEGRVARISGYVDGFKIWKTLFDEGYDGVIRGDEAFGSVTVGSQKAVRCVASLTTLADYFSPEECEGFELPPQRLPEWLLQGRGETLATWRDRLYQQFRVPTLLAGLTDLKTAYVEVCSPLLARSVLDCVRALPDVLRTEKLLWHELVGAQFPTLPLATRVAIPSLTEALSDRRVLSFMLDELTSERTTGVFAPLLRARCCAALRTALRDSRSVRRENRGHPLLSRAMPARLRTVVRNWRNGRPTVEPLALAFRAFVAARMHRLLQADAATAAGLEPAVNA